MTARPKILVVDDDREFRLLIGTQLRSRNMVVFDAADVIQAISLAREKRPDVILLYIGLPGGDGFLILERFKANTLFSAIPIIIVTARDLKGVEEKALQARAAASLQKPVAIEGLVTVIEQVLPTLPPTPNFRRIPQDVALCQPIRPSAPCPFRTSSFWSFATLPIPFS